MYAGHAALALLAKGIRPRISLAVLVPVAFGPDWIEWFLSATGRENRALSHSLVSVAICATIVAAVYWSFTRAPVDACIVWLTYASHWPADFITGIKPTWPGGPDVGLLLYDNPFVDTIVEWTLVVLCWLVYRRSLPAQNRNRPLAYLIPIGLCALQIGFHAIQKPEVKEPLREIIGLAVNGGTVFPTQLFCQRPACCRTACLLQHSLTYPTRADHGRRQRTTRARDASVHHVRQ